MTKLNSTLNNILKILSVFKQLTPEKCPITITNSQILTPLGDVYATLFFHKSKLKDQLVNIDLLKDVLVKLEQNNAIIRLNHIGFGYKVTSQQVEKQRLIQLAKKTDQYLYEEKSSDFALWLFLGNTQNWELPLIEFCPVEQEHSESDYFLPHMQFDIDTTQDSAELDNVVKSIFNNRIYTYPLAFTNGHACILRCRLGVIDGVNIFFDLATKYRNVKAHRVKCMRQIS